MAFVIPITMNAGNNQQQKSAGKILLKIDLDDEIMEWRNEEIIGGLKWCLKAKLVAQENGKMMLAISISGDDSVNYLWFAKVRIGMNLLGMERKTKYFFNGNAYTALVARMEKKLNLILYMEVLRSNANNKMALDTDLRFAYTERDDENVDKDVALASISGYFNNLFFGTFSECSAIADSFDINEEANFNEKEFAFMVYSAMAMGWMVHESEILTDEMAMKILKLSIKYDIPMMQNYCEQYFIKSVTYSKMELLEIGDQLGNEKLMEHALDTMTLICIDLGQFSEIRARLSEKTKKLLDKRLLELADELIVKDEKTKTTFDL